MRCFVGNSSGVDHFNQLLGPVIDQCRACFVGSAVKANDVSIGKVVVVG